MFDLKDYPKLLPIAEAPALTYCMIARDSDANTVATVAWNADNTVVVFSADTCFVVSLMAADSTLFDVHSAFSPAHVTVHDALESICTNIVQWEYIQVRPTKRVNV